MTPRKRTIEDHIALRDQWFDELPKLLATLARVLGKLVATLALVLGLLLAGFLARVAYRLTGRHALLVRALRLLRRQRP